jgi:predicted metal-dependent hydrolase
MQGLLQFTLDLFESRSKPDVAIERPAGMPAPSAELSPGADFAPAPVSLPPQTLQQALAPATFRHPNATREALLGSILVAYQFRRGRRRTIGFSVGPEGLSVSAPKWVPLYDVDKAVLEKAPWIIRKLQEARERHLRLESARIVWQDGVTLPFLGEQVRVVLDPSHAFGGIGAALKTSAALVLLNTDTEKTPNRRPGDAPLTLQVALPRSATAEQIRDAVQAWLMRQAKSIFAERLDHFAPGLGVQWRKLSLSSAGTRWGSASADGSIRLNWRLIHFRRSVIDYVVVHELSHLRVMDHSPRFWDTVRAVVPDYAVLRGQLKDEGLPRW